MPQNNDDEHDWETSEVQDLIKQLEKQPDPQDQEIVKKLRRQREKIRKRQNTKTESLHNFFKTCTKPLTFTKKIISKGHQKILDSNGFLTSEGKYVSKCEWHSVAIPASLVSASFILPKPLGLLTFLSYLFMNKRGFDLLQSDYEGHWNDVMEEYAYAASSFVVTIALWTYFTEESIAGASEINQILLRLFVGA